MNRRAVTLDRQLRLSGYSLDSVALQDCGAARDRGAGDPAYKSGRLYHPTLYHSRDTYWLVAIIPRQR
jgi:hypothetical protein